jgi:hypothetical protein
MSNSSTASFCETKIISEEVLTTKDLREYLDKNKFDDITAAIIRKEIAGTLPNCTKEELNSALQNYFNQQNQDNNTKKSKN